MTGDGQVGRLERVPMSEVWKYEDADFTPWLKDNIEVLNEVLEDLTILDIESEITTGDLRVDLVGEDAEGGTVVIENQFGKSDHDHLGKLITYATLHEAEWAIWIVGDPRPEHVTTLSALNESGETLYYMVKVEAARIGQSPPAPLLTPIVEPGEATIRAGEEKEERAERDKKRHAFWTRLLNHANEKTDTFRTISPKYSSTIGRTIGGIRYGLYVLKNTTRIQMGIDVGSKEENEAVFDELHDIKDRIEDDFGEALEWKRLDGQRSCHIVKEYDIGGWADEARWPDVIEEMVDGMVRLERAFKGPVQKAVG